MKKISALLILAAMVLTVFPVHAKQEKKQTPPQLEYYDAQIEVLRPRLVQFQDEYRAAYGRHFQALKSHSAPPSDLTPPDRLSGKPTDQDEDLSYFWASRGQLPDRLAWSFAINTYAGPEGEGYVLVIDTVLQNKTWRREVNFGPETWREQAWYEVVVSEP